VRPSASRDETFGTPGSDCPDLIHCRIRPYMNHGGTRYAVPLARRQRRGRRPKARAAHAGPQLQDSTRSARLTRTPAGCVLLAALSPPGPARGSLTLGQSSPRCCPAQTRVQTGMSQARRVRAILRQYQLFSWRGMGRWPRCRSGARHRFLRTADLALGRKDAGWVSGTWSFPQQPSGPNAINGVCRASGYGVIANREEQSLWMPGVSPRREVAVPLHLYAVERRRGQRR
jgi:hypothetical protein